MCQLLILRVVASLAHSFMMALYQQAIRTKSKFLGSCFIPYEEIGAAGLHNSGTRA